MSRTTLFKGLSAFPITPTNAAGQVDVPALTKILARLSNAKVDSIGLLGSTGGYAYLDRTERRRTVEAAVDILKSLANHHDTVPIPLIVGVGALTTRDAQFLASDAQAAGATGLLLAPISYTPLTQEEVYQHFVAVAKTTDLPLCIYNNPGTTHFTFTLDLLSRLAATEKNICAVKMPLPQAGTTYEDDLKQLRDALPDGFDIGYSGDWGCADGMIAGADAWYSVAAGVFPIPALQLARAAISGRVSEAQSLDRAFHPLWELFQEHGSLRVIYAAANILSLTDAQPPRPILPLDEKDYKRVAAAIKDIDEA